MEQGVTRVVDLSPCYNRNIEGLTTEDCSEKLVSNRHHLLTGERELWGIPFALGANTAENNVILLKDGDQMINFPEGIHDRQLVFVHAADFKKSPVGADGIDQAMRGTPRLGETVCVYTLQYSDGTSHAVPIRRRYEISEFKTAWGENSFEAVKHEKPFAIPEKSNEREGMTNYPWGKTQIRTTFQGERANMHHWLYALENPHTGKSLLSIHMHPVDGTALVFGLTRTNLSSHPLRWGTRQKVKLRNASVLNHYGEKANIRIDMGAVISVAPALIYDHRQWENTHLDPQPTVSSSEWIVEFTAHPDAKMILQEEGGGIKSIPVCELDQLGEASMMENQTQLVKLRITEKNSGKLVPAKIHIHGSFGEYLAPIHGHRLPNAQWFEDYGVEHVKDNHYYVYINGEAEYKLPKGEVFIEVTKGLEIRPVRKRLFIDEELSVVTIELENVLPWRQRGWVTADTHVHFLSPQTALLEGEAEGVNVVNLLTSQWGEMFSNLGDFDGKTTIGSIENGGSGEYLVRVGTENRQHILGHISLLGYQGSMIVPLCTGGPDESALGDPLEATITQWARECRERFGLAVLPHLPNPRAEGAAAIVLGEIDAVEMCSFEVSGINPYSLSDWYRYLNCGYQVPAVAGTDKMSQSTAVGTIRTYALIQAEAFTYNSWMRAVKRGVTFVTYGPLMEFMVSGHEMGSQFALPHAGGTVDVVWSAATTTIPITKIELVVNGELRELKTVDCAEGQRSGNWSLKVQESCWVALRIRGAYPGQPEIIIAHSSAVFIQVDGQRCFRSIDAMSILEQIEGSTAYIKTLATQADEKVFKRLLATLNSAHTALHHRMHQHHVYHEHTAPNHHHDHHH